MLMDEGATVVERDGVTVGIEDDDWMELETTDDGGTADDAGVWEEAGVDCGVGVERMTVDVDRTV